jgi:hypothetical protein
MPVALLELPTGETLEIVYLRKLPDLGDLIYLHSIRTGRVTEAVEKLYKTMAPFYAGRLAQSVVQVKPSFDAIVSPPSERADADLYRNALIELTGARDLSERFSRKGKVKASTASSVQEVIDEFDYAAQGDEPKINSLMIADESVASGATVVAVLVHLRRAGLREDCKIMVSAPAWLKR